MKEKIKKITDEKILHKNKWKLYLYYKGIRIKKIYVDMDFAPADNFYPIRIYFKKFLFGSNIVSMVFRFEKLKYTNDLKKETHIEVYSFKGVDI